MLDKLLADPNAIRAAVPVVFALVAFIVFIVGGSIFRARPRPVALPDQGADIEEEAMADDPVPMDSTPLPKAANRRSGATIAPPPVVERRQPSGRSRGWVKVVLADEDLHDLCMDAWLTDYTAKGIGLLVFQEITEGRVLRVRPATAADTVPWTRVEARFCRHLEKNTWSAGCMFLEKPQWSPTVGVN
jgi:hypothetical protein